MLYNYLRIAARNLRISLAYTLLNVTGLGLGMAGAMLIFLFLRHHLSTDAHQPFADRLYRVVLELHLDEGIEYEPGSAYAFSEALKNEYAGIEKSGFVRKMPVVTLSAGSGSGVRRFMEKDNIAYAGSGFMDLFAYQWKYKPADVNEPFTIVLSQKLARKYYGTDDVVGRIIRLDNRHDLKVTGVVFDDDRPTDFPFDAFISLSTLKAIEPGGWLTDFTWTSSRNFTFVRLHTGMAATRLESLIAANVRKNAGENARYFRYRLQPLHDIHFDENYGGKIRRPIVWMLGGVGLFLMVIASINFINLATAQAARRSREIGVRKVLGGTRRQLFWQFIVETACVTLLSALFSILIVIPLLPLLNNWTQTQAFHPGGLIRTEVLGFGLAAMLLIVVLAGFYPAVIVSGFNPVNALKGRIGAGQAGAVRLRHSLVIVQLVIAQILIAGTLALVLQLRFFRNADLGFDQKAVMKITLPTHAHPNRQSLRNDLLQYPDVRALAFQYDSPTSDMGFGGSVRFDNRAEWEKFVIRERFADPGYLETYQMPLLAGRTFSDRDSVHEFVVNEEMMKKLGVRDPQQMLGKKLEDGSSGFAGHIVGVVKSFHLKSLHDAIEPCAIYANPEQYREVAVKLHTSDLASSVRRIRGIWKKHFPDEVFTYAFADEKIAAFYDKEAQLTSLIRAFAFVAIIICCLGLYGMVSFMVTRKTKEIGVRKVLGAGVESIMFLFGKEFFSMIAIATLLSAPIAWLLIRNWLSHFAYRIDLPWWLVTAGSLLIIPITVLTVGYKVWRAAVTDPVRSLSVE